MIVINLFGVPGAGKTINAQLLAAKLSIEGYCTEYIPELARFATYQDNKSLLKDQVQLFAHQNHFLETFSQKGVEIAVSDSPLPNSFIYLPEKYYTLFKPFVMEVFNSYENINFWLRKNSNLPHAVKGRTQSLEAALELEPKLEKVFKDYAIEHETLITQPGVEDILLNKVLAKLIKPA